MKDQCRKKLMKILKANTEAKAIVLFDASQGSSIDSGILPKEFKKKKNEIVLSEVVRSSPLLTDASKVFQRYKQNETTNHLDKVHKGQGLHPRARIFASVEEENDDEDFGNYVREVIDELNYIKDIFRDENLHNTAAIILPNENSRKRLLEAGLDKKMEEHGIGLKAVTAMVASERFSNDPLNGGDENGYLIVDSIANMNGMELLFVIVVDMDKPLEEDDEEKNHKNLSEIYCACTRGMLHVSFVNKFISNRWMSFFQFTETRPAHSTPSVSMPSDIEGCVEVNPPVIDTLSTKQPLSNESVESMMTSSPLNDEEERKTESITGFADSVCQRKSDRTASSFKTSEVAVMARTNIFHVVKKLFLNEGDKMSIPAFRPLQTNCGLSELDPYIYLGGEAPRVPFIKIRLDVKKIDKDAFKDNDHIVRLEIPDAVTCIGEDAFARCRSMEYVNFPTSLETIGSGAFWDCERLKEVTLNSKVVTIEECTFSGCSSLKKVKEMNHIKSIKKWAFMDCSSLSSIDLDENVQIVDEAFKNCAARINYIKRKKTVGID